jgi:hypothetical protein
MSTSLPVAILMLLGTLVTLLGLFAAGSIVVATVGLFAVFGAGLLDASAKRVRA